MPSLPKVHDLSLVYVLALKPQVRACLKPQARAVCATLLVLVLCMHCMHDGDYSGALRTGSSSERGSTGLIIFIDLLLR